MLMGLSFLLGQSKKVILQNANQASKRFRLDEPDFEPDEWVLDDNKLGALAFSQDGSELALLRVSGANISTRRLPVSSISTAYNEPTLSFFMGDPTWPNFSLSIPSGRLQSPSLRALLTPNGRSNS